MDKPVIVTFVLKQHIDESLAAVCHGEILPVPANTVKGYVFGIGDGIKVFRSLSHIFAHCFAISAPSAE
jgi:hypothetical protein